jgi:hypothetical protein
MGFTQQILAAIGSSGSDPILNDLIVAYSFENITTLTDNLGVHNGTNYNTTTEVGLEGNARGIIGLMQAYGGNNVYYIGHKSSGAIRGRIYTTITNTFDSTLIANLNQWNRIVMRWKSGEPIKINLNGTEQESPIITGTPTVAGLDMAVSMDPAWGATSDVRQITGRVDEAMIWRRKLSDAEVTQLFTGNPTYAELS